MSNSQESSSQRISTSESGSREDPGSLDRRPTVQTSMIDQLNLTNALRDFENANARVVNLTSRLTLMNEELQRLRHEIIMIQISKSNVSQLEAERDAALAEVDIYRLSLSYRIGYRLTRIVSKFVP